MERLEKHAVKNLSQHSTLSQIYYLTRAPPSTVPVAGLTEFLRVQGHTETPYP